MSDYKPISSVHAFALGAIVMLLGMIYIMLVNIFEAMQ